MEPDNLSVISESELHRAIKSLNMEKLADEMGLTSEHLEYTGSVLLKVIASVFNKMLTTHDVSDSFKSKIISPVHNYKLKDPCKMAN
ncbi:MAG: hypothetical protein AB2693_25720 [Candidatus Thiodiazotropha sp.]